MVMAGRGFGKTRTGVEWIRGMVEGPTPLTAPSGAPEIITIIGDTPADIRDYIIEGLSGFSRQCPKWCKPEHQPSKRRLVWPNGIRALLLSAEDPDSIRGASGSVAWWDELAKARYQSEGWENLMYALREGDPRILITTTPQPTKLIRELVTDPSTVVTNGSSYENRSNLSEKYFEKVIKPREGTRLGRQEIHAELLSDVPGALWTWGMLDGSRIRPKHLPDLDRVVVAVDPPVTSGPDSDECGIIMGGRKGDQGYILADLTVQGKSPQEWAQIAVNACYGIKIGEQTIKADRIVAEVNNGGDLVEAVIRQVDRNISYRKVHASRGKVTRAEPIAAMYEQGRVHHVGTHTKLEGQMCEFTTNFDKGTMGYSPDRVDAAVWLLTELFPVQGKGLTQGGF